MDLSVEQQTLYRLGVALALGLLVGVERGWQAREAREGERIAGVRTYGLLGLLGGVGGAVAERLGALTLGLLFIGVATVVATAYVANLRRAEDVGITSVVAALLTVMFGAVAVMGELVIAASGAVVTVLLLGAKPTLHRWVELLEPRELRAGLKLLLISVVLLPILPDRGYGPWQALNPYEIWWMVVLIALISFAGYFAVKIGGARRGTVFTGLFAGLASSTALTLHFARMARRHSAMSPALATGILLACGTMFPRTIVIAGVLNPGLVAPLLAPALLMAAVAYGAAFIYWRASRETKAGSGARLPNPLELKAAVSFGALLALIMLLGQALKAWAGTGGLLALAGASGLADVDAITLSLARMSADDLAAPTAVIGVVIAAAANTLIKAVMAVVVGGRSLAYRVALPLLLAAGGGLLVVWWLPDTIF